MSRKTRQIVAIVIAVGAIAVAILMFMWVQQAPTERNLEGQSTEKEVPSDPEMEPGPEDPPAPEITPAPPANPS